MCLSSSSCPTTQFRYKTGDFCCCDNLCKFGPSYSEDECCKEPACQGHFDICKHWISTTVNENTLTTELKPTKAKTTASFVTVSVKNSSVTKLKGTKSITILSKATPTHTSSISTVTPQKISTSDWNSSRDVPISRDDLHHLTKNWHIYASVATSVLVLAVLVYIVYKMKKTAHIMRQNIDRTMNDYLPQTDNVERTYQTPNANRVIQGQLREFYDIPWINEINVENLELGQVLGAGHYGSVRKGTLTVKRRKCFIEYKKKIDVAMKSIAENVENSQAWSYSLKVETKALLLIRRHGGHPNVVEFVGYCTSPRQFLLMQFCENGSLLSYITKRQNTFPQLGTPPLPHEVEFDKCIKRNQLCHSALLMYALQIANGMDFIAKLNLKHRDIALRNTLLTSEQVIKISDFGLVVKTDAYRLQYRNDLPWWQFPPESLMDSENERIFSVKSDVWSYAVLLWELYTLGKHPYSFINHNQQHPINQVHYKSKLLNGEILLTKPKYASDQIYELMKKCWSIEPEQRPDFGRCVQQFRSCLHNTSIPVEEYIVGKIGLDNVCVRNFV